MPAPESTLVILVPEAEELVSPFRDRYDPAAAVGVPAHVTLIYPFKPPDELRPPVIDGLRQCFAGFPAFDFVLARLQRFPQVLYLAPEPAEPFREVTKAIWKRHPETPPYGGLYPDIVPHLTLADRIESDATLDRIETEVIEAARNRLPVRARAAEVALLENRTGRWQTLLTLSLGR